MQWEAATPVGFQVCVRHPDKSETFLRVPPHARVEKISSGQWANQVPFWDYLGMSLGAPQLDPSFQIYFFLRF